MKILHHHLISSNEYNLRRSKYQSNKVNFANSQNNENYATYQNDFIISSKKKNITVKNNPHGLKARLQLLQATIKYSGWLIRYWYKNTSGYLDTKHIIDVCAYVNLLPIK